MSCVDDVLDDKHIPTRDVRAEVHKDAHDTARLAHAGTIAGNGHKIDAMGNGDGPHQVGEKHHAPLEHTHQQQIFARVITRNRCAQLLDARAQSLFGDQYLSDVLLPSLILLLHVQPLSGTLYLGCLPGTLWQ